ncbi:MAG TPA: SRPBCC family protein [Thalassobaculum sp.]
MSTTARSARQSGKTVTARPSDRELTLTRVYDAPPETLYRAWTDPAMLKRWIAPRPYETVRAEMDVRPGGLCSFVMKGPDGAEIPCPGVYLEVVENRRLVTTDAYTAAWQPAEKPFMTVILTFEDEGGRTRYTARCLHWTAEDCDAHENMGFHEGWAQVAEQLAELVE